MAKAVVAFSKPTSGVDKVGERHKRRIQGTLSGRRGCACKCGGNYAVHLRNTRRFSWNK